MPEQPSRPWSTSISDVEDSDVFVRGYRLADLIGRVSFATATYLLIRGRMPSPAQSRVMEAALCSVLDYALRKPGTVAARYCVSGNPSMVAGIATAALSVGEYTLAPDQAGKFIAENMAEHRDDEACRRLSQRLHAQGQRVPGFGHPVFRNVDPRAQKLKLIAQREAVWGSACAWYGQLHAGYTAASGRPGLVINEVGMLAAILTDMGFTPPEMTGIALLSSLPGVVAHVSEELRSQLRIRAVPDESVAYTRDRHELETDLAACGWPDETAP
jgi:citryl-CoA lyase